jgi:protein TonB
MSATKNCFTVLAAASLLLGAAQSMAADRPARIDEKSCEKPAFPARWQDEGDEGKVTLAFLVDTDGKVLDTKVIESSGYGRVDRASLKAGARCKFEPGAKAGQAAQMWAKVQYSWVVE